MTDYYHTLGIDYNATADDIKRAYRKLSFENHPDRNLNKDKSNKKIAEINNAYETLKDPNKKKIYDTELNLNKMFNSNNLNSQNFNDKNPNFLNPGNLMNMLFSGGSQHNTNPIDLSSLFGFGRNIPDIHIIGSMGVDFDGEIPNHFPFINPNINNQNIKNNNPLFNKPSKNNISKPKTLTYNIDITYKEAYKGIKKPLEITRTIIENNFTTEEQETIYVDIQEGIDDGEIIMLKEQGNVIQNNKGDIKVFIKIKDHDTFKRDGLNLLFVKEITLKDALCGFSFSFDHINDNNYTINNKSGNIIKNNYVKVIPKLGFNRNNDIGNLHIIFDIKFPDSLNNEQINELKNIL